MNWCWKVSGSQYLSQFPKGKVIWCFCLLHHILKWRQCLTGSLSFLVILSSFFRGTWHVEEYSPVMARKQGGDLETSLKTISSNKTIMHNIWYHIRLDYGNFLKWGGNARFPFTLPLCTEVVLFLTVCCLQLPDFPKAEEVPFKHIAKTPRLQVANRNKANVNAFSLTRWKKELQLQKRAHIPYTIQHPS